jgi:uncharacterized protein (TIGR00255 family)
MLSMTGFGLGQTPLGGGSISAEVRSLNHRFLDLRVRLPPEMADQTFFVEQLCREQLTRGRYDVGVRVEGAALPGPSIDLSRARDAYAALQRLRDELAPGTEVPLALLATFPALLQGPGSGDPAPLRHALTVAIGTALAGLDEMREKEGAALAVELRARLRTMREIWKSLLEHGPTLAALQQQRLQQRLERLLGGVSGLDPSRLAMEVALLADRSDITEELVRLGSHFDQFESTLETAGPIGRKLDFLLQEMARESNTIGAKCQDGNLSHWVVSLKAEVERLREQVQNVE